mgnify:CR=1 FL=1
MTLTLLFFFTNLVDVFVAQIQDIPLDFFAMDESQNNFLYQVLQVGVGFHSGVTIMNLFVNSFAFLEFSY